MLTLGAEHGGCVGSALDGGVATLLGGTGASLVGVTALLAGRAPAHRRLARRAPPPLAVTRSAARTARAPRRAPDALEPQVLAPPPALAPHEPPVDVEHDYPDVVAEGLSEPPPLLARRRTTDRASRRALFDAPARRGRRTGCPTAPS